VTSRGIAATATPLRGGRARAEWSRFYLEVLVTVNWIDHAGMKFASDGTPAPLSARQIRVVNPHYASISLSSQMFSQQVVKGVLRRYPPLEGHAQEHASSNR